MNPVIPSTFQLLEFDKSKEVARGLISILKKPEFKLQNYLSCSRAMMINCNLVKLHITKGFSMEQVLLNETRKIAIKNLITEAGLAISRDGVSRAALVHIEAALATLAKSASLFSLEEFPVSSDVEKYAIYEVHVEPNSGMALYLNVLQPGKSSKPHNHTTWAAIAALQGEEANTVYRRVDDGSIPGKAQLEVTRKVVVQPGTTASFMPDDIHSIEGQGVDVIRHLHLYGRPLDQLTGRLGFDVKAGTVVNYNTAYMTPAIVRHVGQKT